MARGIALSDFEYEIDDGVSGTPATNAIAKCFIRMDKFNVGTKQGLIKPTTANFLPLPFHVKLRLNETEFGIHPRHVIGELALSANASACYGTQPKRRVIIPVLTLAQFNEMIVYNKKTLGKGQDAKKYTITVNHSNDGKTSLNYFISSKHEEVKI